MSGTDVSYTDASGEVDLDNIDTFTRDGDTYHLMGGWGAISVNGGSCALTIA